MKKYFTSNFSGAGRRAITSGSRRPIPPPPTPASRPVPLGQRSKTQPPWVRERLPDQVFTFEKKEYKTDQQKENARWTKPRHQFFKKDGSNSEELFVGDNVPHFEPDDLEIWRANFAKIQPVFDVVTKVFLPKDWVEQVIEETRHYARTNEATDELISKLTVENFYKYLAALTYSGIMVFPNKDMYFGTAFGEGSQVMKDLFTRDTFRLFEKYLHLAGQQTTLEEKRSDRFWKLKPLFDLLNKSGNNFPKCRDYSVDESMIRFYGHHQDKVYMPAKPIKWGFKMWCLTSSNGVLYHIFPSQGAQTKTTVEGYGQGPDVVLSLVIAADVPAGARVYMDNLYTTLDLIKQLSRMGIGGTGTVRQNRLFQIPLPEPKTMEKEFLRGQSETVYSEDVSIVGWKDNKPVFVMSNTHSARVNNNKSVERWSRAEKARIELPQPDSIHEYNQNMGGVDLLDQMVGNYPPNLHTRKWWVRIFHQGIQILLNQAWRFWQLKQENKVPFRKFLMEFVESTVKIYGIPRPKSRLATPNKPSKFFIKQAPHLAEASDSRARCSHCNQSKVSIRCMTCNKFFHVSKVKNCFARYHLAHLNAGQDVEDDVSDPDGDVELEEMLAMDVQAIDGDEVGGEEEYARLANQDGAPGKEVNEPSYREVVVDIQQQIEDILALEED